MDVRDDEFIGNSCVH